jgi:hypothetical protein
MSVPGSGSSKNLTNRRLVTFGSFWRNLSWLKTCAEPLPSIESLSVSKRDHFRYEAMSLHSSDMREMKPTKRHALAVVLVNTQLAQAYDDLADLLTRVISIAGL